MIADAVQLSGTRIAVRPRRSASAADYVGRAAMAAVVLTWLATPVIGFTNAVGVLTAGALVAVTIGLRACSLGLYGIALLCTLDPASRVFLSDVEYWRWNTLNYWLCVVILLFLPSLLRVRNIPTRLLLCLIGLLGAELLWSTSISAGVQHLLGIATALGILVYFARVASEPRAWYWAGVLAAANGALGGFAFYVYRADLPYMNLNAWSYFPLTGIFGVCLALRWGTDSQRAWRLLLALAAVDTTWVFLSGSRGSLLVALCCLVFLVTRVRGLSHRTVSLAFGVILVIGLATQFSELQDFALHRVDKSFDSSRSLERVTSGRSDLAVAGWHIFVANPLGIGTGSFASAWAAVGESDSGFREGLETAAHSGWVKTLAENGVFGISLLAAYVLSYSLAGWARRRRGLLGIGVLASAVIAVALMSTEFQAKGLWFLTMGATVTLFWPRKPRAFPPSGPRVASDSEAL